MRQVPGAGELVLYRAVDEVLHYVWDPIGVAQEPYARDKYHSYLPQVFSLVLAAAEDEQVANYLSQVAEERMGLTENRGHDLRVAQILSAWRGKLEKQDQLGKSAS